MKLYLGFDGAYVLSRYPLKVFESGGQSFLSTRTRPLLDINARDAADVLGPLKLKPFEVVEIAVGKKRTMARRVGK